MEKKQKILIVDDNEHNIQLMHHILGIRYEIVSAENGTDALMVAGSNPQPDLILLDIMMPDMDGYAVCKKLKNDAATASIPVIFVTAMIDVDDEARGLELGAVDYITKPISPATVMARVKNHLDLKLYKDHLEDLVEQRTSELREGYIDTIFRLTLTSEYKDFETGAHIRRISHYTKELAQQLGMGAGFCDTIFYASPMHDIGKVAIPDAVLLKQGPLDASEWDVMKTHSEVGAKILESSKSPYLQAAAEIAGYHHERWDGNGYPEGLKGEAIPLPARIMNITDQYDALRSVRPYKPAFDHDKTVTIITRGDGRTTPEHFDPDVLAAFKKSADVFNDIFTSLQD